MGDNGLDAQINFYRPCLVGKQMKNRVLLNSILCVLLVFLSASVTSQSRANCGSQRKDCSLGPWTGGDGKAQIYKLLCCDLNEDCGSALLPGQKRPDPYCKRKPVCDWRDGR